MRDELTFYGRRLGPLWAMAWSSTGDDATFNGRTGNLLLELTWPSTCDDLILHGRNLTFCSRWLAHSYDMTWYDLFFDPLWEMTWSHVNIYTTCILYRCDVYIYTHFYIKMNNVAGLWPREDPPRWLARSACAIAAHNCQFSNKECASISQIFTNFRRNLPVFR